ncbi:MAG: flagellar basal-body rod protein FlgF [Chloroflexota bacterium]
MIRGLYNSASSMVALEKRMEVATTNLANVDTNGFKQDRTAIATFAEQLVARMTANEGAATLGNIGLADITAAPDTDWTQGSLQKTERELDLALSGGGLFSIQAPEGIRYTRNGAFTRNAQNVLTTTTGRPLLGQNGPIQLPDGEVTVSSNGTVSVGDIVVDQLRIVEFANPDDLRRLGSNELTPKDPAVQPQAATATSVQQGMVEMSNVDITATMTTIMEIQRAYEANQRMIQSQNELAQRAVSDIARPSA